ncbi:MAG: replication-associated recombination protein A [Fimbriimonadaceae bacterium]|nr:replication-associated recombination protein A [Fimbriimonadaceae bacterium]
MQPGLFAESASASLPLAARMRPRSLAEFVGQVHLLGPGGPTRPAIEAGALGSVVLWAPPGCGKTTLAYLIAAYKQATVETRSAVTAGVADVRKIAEAARLRRQTTGHPTLLVLDEIHHFNRSQQDSLLGYLEDGTFELVGCTTENPFFVLAPALLSRARVLPLKPLGDEELGELARRALADEERGLGGRRLGLEEDALTHLVRCANGDARLVLNALETASALVPDGTAIALAQIEEVLQRPAVRYDRQGDYHYDTISAFIKSVRGSDADAALHYLARMIEAGEDPRFIVRRLIILASEDIGNADPQSLVLAVAASQAVERIGMPEGRIVLGQITTYLAEAPKSNAACLAVDKALGDVRTRPLAAIPMPLRNAPVSGLKELGHGEGYRYPHDFPGHWVSFQYLPDDDGLAVPYYRPTEQGYEARIRDRRRQRDGS